MLYRLGSEAGSYENAREQKVDVLLFDLEDSVSPAHKDEARTKVLAAIAAGGFAGQEILVRVNGPETRWGQDDLKALAQAPIDGIMLAKSESGRQMRDADAALTAAGGAASPKLWAMIETPRGVLSADDIAGASPRMAGIAIGLGDLSRGMGGFRRAAPFRFPVLAALSQVLLAARAHGLAAVDSSFRDARDPDGFRAACLESRELGYDGKAFVQAEFAPIADAAFAPSEDEFAWSKRVLAAVAAAPKGLQVTVEGQLIEPGYIDVAERIATAAAWPRRGV
jgi:citrate lyase subunit beta/citryl-CoA lyase